VFYLTVVKLQITGRTLLIFKSQESTATWPNLVKALAVAVAGNIIVGTNLSIALTVTMS
jgi:hypothetical protein